MEIIKMKQLLAISIALFLTVQSEYQAMATCPTSRISEASQKGNQLRSATNGSGLADGYTPFGDPTIGNSSGLTGGDTPSGDPTIGNSSGLTGGETPGNDPTIGGPIGNAWPLLFILSGIYAIIKTKDKKQKKTDADL
jgi:hypothetical protein